MTSSIVRNALLLTAADPEITEAVRMTAEREALDGRRAAAEIAEIARLTAEREASDARVTAALANLYEAFNA